MSYVSKLPGAENEPLFREASKLMEQLEQAGFRAYVVGGSVRDALLGREIHDVDIATSATPAQVRALFPHTVPTGLQHGTVTVVSGKSTFEVTTFRREGPYNDARRPDYVRFVGDLTEDLARRDFTINAIACDRKGHMVDPYGGKQDLERRVIRCVGNASDRFREDALRILRAVRFAAQLDFDVDSATLNAMETEKAGLRHLAAERITSELDKLLSSPRPAKVLRLLWERQLLPFITPLCVTQTFLNPPTHQLQHLDDETDPSLRWILFLRLCGIEEGKTRNVLRRLKMPRKQIRELSTMWHEAECWAGTFFTAGQARRKVFALQLGRLLKIVRLAYRFGRLTESEWQRLRRQFCHADWELPLDEPSQLAVDGHTLIRLTGRRPGAWIGEVLQSLLEKVVSGEVVNHPVLLEKEWRKNGPHAP